MWGWGQAFISVGGLKKGNLSHCRMIAESRVSLCGLVCRNAAVFTFIAQQCLPGFLSPPHPPPPLPLLLGIYTILQFKSCIQRPHLHLQNHHCSICLALTLLRCLFTQMSTKEKLISHVMKEEPVGSRNKVTVVGVGMVGMASAISILLKVRGANRETMRSDICVGGVSVC